MRMNDFIFLLTLLVHHLRDASSEVVWVRPWVTSLHLLFVRTWPLSFGSYCLAEREAKLLPTQGPSETYSWAQRDASLLWFLVPSRHF